MAERTRGMGRGLSAILSSTVPVAEGAEPHPELREIPLGDADTLDAAEGSREDLEAVLRYLLGEA